MVMSGRMGRHPIQPPVVRIEPVFMGRLRSERLTSNQMFSNVEALPGGKSNPPDHLFCFMDYTFPHFRQLNSVLVSLISQHSQDFL